MIQMGNEESPLPGCPSMARGTKGPNSFVSAANKYGGLMPSADGDTMLLTSTRFRGLAARVFRVQDSQGMASFPPVEDSKFSSCRRDRMT